MAGNDLSAYAAQVGSLLESVKSEFKGKLDGIHAFISNYTEYGGVSGAYSSPVTVTLNSIASLESDINRLTFTAPTRPSGLEAMQPEKYKRHVFEATGLDSLEDTLMNLVTTADVGILKELSGVGVDVGFQEALYHYQRTNDIHDLEYELSALDGKWAADGYVLPPDALVHNRAWLVARFDEKRTDRTRNIFSELTKLAQQNVQWAYENGIKIEQLHADFAIRYSQIYKDVIDAIVAIYRADIDVAITALEAGIKQLSAKVEVAKLGLDKDKTQNELEISQANARLSSYVSSYNASISANTTIASQRIQAATNVATGYQAIFNAHGGQYTGISLETKKV